MPPLNLIRALATTWWGRAREEGRARGSISVEQVLITAGLVAITVVALAAIAAGVQKYASRI